MENKYYTPEIWEFRVGFTYEIRVNGTDEWVPITQSQPDFNACLDIKVNADGYREYLVGPFLRCKYLQIGDDLPGWKHVGSGWYGLVEVPGELGYWTYVRLRLWGENTFIKGYRGDPDNTKTEQEHLFQGNIKNQSELKFLMKQLHLCKSL